MRDACFLSLHLLNLLQVVSERGSGLGLSIAIHGLMRKGIGLDLLLLPPDAREVVVRDRICVAKKE